MESVGKDLKNKLALILYGMVWGKEKLMSYQDSVILATMKNGIPAAPVNINLEKFLTIRLIPATAQNNSKK